MTSYKNLSCLILLLFCASQLEAQQEKTADEFQNIANNQYLAQNYLQAAHGYLMAAKLNDFKNNKASNYFNASCCYGLQNMPDSAIIYLQKAINNGWSHKAHTLQDADLTSVRDHKKWSKTISRMKESENELNSDPKKANFVTTDIYNFWKAYGKAQKDTANFKSIFKKYYFDKSSIGMESYMGMKVGDIDYFIKHIRSFPKFYKSIRQDTYKVDLFKKDFLASFQKLKEIYPDAKFPNVYFVIGAFTSGGTISDKGLLIGVNQFCETENTNMDEFGFREEMMSQKLNAIPNLVSHELIHFQQEGLARDTTTLSYSINEGMADFIGELISGNNANHDLHLWAHGKEKRIWDSFKKDMYFNRYNNWLANSGSGDVSSENLPDQGYWVGYQICKAYYEQSDSKTQAVYDILNIKDYRLFLKQSRWEEKVEKM